MSHSIAVCTLQASFSSRLCGGVAEHQPCVRLGSMEALPLGSLALYEPSQNLVYKESFS
jgi:hypothetical protein